MSSTNHRRLAAAIATAGAGALALGGFALPASAATSAPEVEPEVLPAELDAALNITAETGEEALKQLDAKSLEVVAAQSGITVDRVKDILKNDSRSRLSTNGFIYYVEEQGSKDAAPAAAPDVPGSPQEGSRPGAPYTIYLDFDGATLENTQWNIELGETSVEMDASRHTDAQFKSDVWAYIAEDFAPFNINVTTADPGTDALLRTSADDNAYGATAVITATTSPFEGAGGVAFLSGFGGRHLSPALVFDETFDSPKQLADATTHEVGHNLGLDHDGFGSNEYYQPFDPTTIWGPIMGGPYTSPLTQWSNGDYADATNPEQDDLAEITNTEFAGSTVTLTDPATGEQWIGGWCTDGDPNAPAEGDSFVKADGNACGTEPLEVFDFSFLGRAAYAEDDHGNDAASATVLDNTSGEFTAAGVIGQTEEVDYFTLTTTGGPVTIDATTGGGGTNLDILLQLRDANGELIKGNDPDAEVADDSTPDAPAAKGLDASISEDLEPGVYYVAVTGTGFGDPAANTEEVARGYSSYGSLGNYTLSGSAEAADFQPVAITAPEDGATVEAADLEVTGTGEPGASVALTVGDAAAGEATVGDDGAWSATLADPLPYGESTITAKQDAEGFASSDAVTVTVALAVPEITKPNDGDTAKSAHPTFEGTGIAGAVVTVNITCGDTSAAGEAEVDADGNWTFQPEDALPNGDCTVVATQTVDGVTSGESEPVAFSVAVDEGGDESGDDSGDAGGNEDGDDDLPDTGSSSMGLIGFAAGLVLLGGGAALYARTRRQGTIS